MNEKLTNEKKKFKARFTSAAYDRYDGFFAADEAEAKRIAKEIAQQHGLKFVEFINNGVLRQASTSSANRDAGSGPQEGAGSE